MDKFIKFIEKQCISNKFEQSKKDWLMDDNNNGYINDKTKITYWRLFNTNVFQLEKSYNKDLRQFTSIEIMNLVRGAITNSIMTKRTLYSAINNYLVYCVERGHISYNPCDSIDTDGLFEVNAKAMRNTYMRLDEFYKYLDSLDANDVEKMFYVLIRYGVPAKSAGDVRWDDVHEDEELLDVVIKDKLIRLEIDQEFIRRVRLAKACKTNMRGVLYEDTEYVLKSINKDKSKISSVYGIIENVAKRSKVPRVDLGMLSKNRRFDLVDEIYEEFGEVTSFDLKDVLDRLGSSSTASQVSIFKNEVETVLDIEVKKRKTGKSIEVINTQTGEVDIFESLIELQENSERIYGFKADKPTVTKCCRGQRQGIRHLKFRYADE